MDVVLDNNRNQPNRALHVTLFGVVLVLAVYFLYNPVLFYLGFAVRDSSNTINKNLSSYTSIPSGQVDNVPRPDRSIAYDLVIQRERSLQNTHYFLKKNGSLEQILNFPNNGSDPHYVLFPEALILEGIQIYSGSGPSTKTEGSKIVYFNIACKKGEIFKPPFFIAGDEIPVLYKQFVLINSLDSVYVYDLIKKVGYSTKLSTNDDLAVVKINFDNNTIYWHQVAEWSYHSGFFKQKFNLDGKDLSCSDLDPIQTEGEYRAIPVQGAVY